MGRSAHGERKRGVRALSSACFVSISALLRLRSTPVPQPFRLPLLAQIEVAPVFALFALPLASILPYSRCWLDSLRALRTPDGVNLLQVAHGTRRADMGAWATPGSASRWAMGRDADCPFLTFLETFSLDQGRFLISESPLSLRGLPLASFATRERKGSKIKNTKWARG